MKNNIDVNKEELQEKYHKVLSDVRKELLGTDNTYSSKLDIICDDFMQKMDQRVKAHIKYIREMLGVHGYDITIMNIVEFHYCTSAKHFVGHAIEDIIDMIKQQKVSENLVGEMCEKILEKIRE